MASRKSAAERAAKEILAGKNYSGSGNGYRNSEYSSSNSESGIQPAVSQTVRMDDRETRKKEKLDAILSELFSDYDSYRSQQWANKFNSTMDALSKEDSRANGYLTKSAIDRYGADVDSLVRDYDSVKDYLDIDWTYNQRLRDLQNEMKREGGWYEKYSGKGYGELRDTLGTMRNTDPEYDWLDSYAKSIVRPEDYREMERKNDAQIEALYKDYSQMESLRQSVDGGQASMEQLRQYNALMKQHGTPMDLKEQIEDLKGENWRYDKAAKYDFLEENKDYAALSQQVPGKKTAGLGIQLGDEWHGQGDPKYDYINNIGNARETHPAQQGKTPYSVYDNMEEKEIANYNYLYNSQGKEAAEEYLGYLEYDLNRRQMGQRAKNVSTFAKEHPVVSFASSLVSSPMNLVSGIGALDVAKQNLERSISGEWRPIDYNNDAMAATVATQALRGTVAQNIADATGTIQLNEQDHPILSRVFNGKSLGDVYQLGMSMVDSGATALLASAGIPGGTVLLGGSAASQGILDALEAGANDSQALTMGILNGTFEALFEYVSLENLLTGNPRNFIMKLAKQGFIEGTEEFCTTLANTVADILVMAEKSDYQKNIVRYMEEDGLDPDKAALKAIGDIAIGMGWDFFGGMLSGGIMGAAAAKIQNYQYAKEAYGSDPGALVGEALEIDPNNALAARMKNKLDAGKTVSGRQLYNLAQQNEKAMRSGDTAAIGKAAAQRLTELGETENVDAVSAALAKQAAGKKLSKSETQLIQNSQYGSQVSQELDPVSVLSGDAASSWAGKIGTQRVRATAYNSRLEQDAQGNEKTSVPGSGTNRDPSGTVAPNMEQGSFTQQETAESEPFRISDDTGKTLMDDTEGGSVETRITGIASSEKGKLMLNVSNRAEPVSAGKISYADAGEAAMYGYLNKMELPAASANYIVGRAKQITEGSSGTQRAEQLVNFSQGLYGMYTLGENGVPLAKAVKSDYAGMLTGDMAQAGYDLGRRVYDARVKAAEAKKKSKAAAQRARAASDGTKVNGVSSYDGLAVSRGKDGGVAVEGVTLNEQQKAGIQAAEMLAGMGVNIHVFQSQTDANGKPVGENGSYSMKDGSVHIDLNAGASGQGVMLYTISHEFTHFMEDQSPAKFQAFTDILFSELETDPEAAIASKAEALKRQHPDTYKDMPRAQLLRDARSEVVAEACETMLSDTDAAQRIGELLKAKDESLFEKVKQWFRDLAKKLREAYRALEPDSRIARDAKKTLRQVDDLVQLWAEMAVDSAENYREAVGSENAEPDSGDIVYHSRATGNEIVSIKEQILSSKNNLDPMKPVADIQADDLSKMNQHQRYMWAVDVLKPSGYKVDRQGFGVIEFTEKQINTGLNYLDTPGEIAALAALPKVLKRGKIIFENDNHKYRNLGSVTIAAPVVINGVRGNMAVVVQKTTTNHYHTHRVLMPNGSSLEFKRNAAPKPLGDLTNNARRATTISAASEDSIRNSEPDVNKKFSMRDSDREDSGPYSYESLISKPDMAITTVGGNVPKSRADVVYQAKQNARKIGKFNIKDGSVSVYVKDIDADVLIGTDGLKHGLRRVRDPQNDPNYIATLKAGEIIQNSIKINEANPKKQNAAASYVLIGVCGNTNGDTYIVRSIVNHFKNELASMDVLYAINAKKELAAAQPPRSTAKPLSVTSSTISISDLLDVVNQVFPDILPESVLRHYGYAARPDGDFGENVLYSDRYSEEGKLARQNEALERKNEKLKADVSNLRDMLKLQGKTTGGKLFKPESIKTAANFVLRQTGRSLDESGKTEFTDILTKAYTALSDENVTYDDILRECGTAAQWLDENGQTKNALDGYAKEILRQMKGTAIRLDKTQVAEVKHVFGSLQAFRKRIAGTYKLSAEGIPLDDAWNEMSIDHPLYFDDGASSADLPRLLVDTIDRLRNTEDTDPYQHMPVERMMETVYDGFWKARKITTVADRYKGKIDTITQKHNTAMKELRAAHKAEMAELNRQWSKEAKAMKESHQYALDFERNRLQAENKSKMKEIQATHKAEVEELNRHWDEEAKAMEESHLYDLETETARIRNEWMNRRKTAVDNRQRKAGRQQIQRVVNDLNKLLLSPDKKNHVPSSLRDAVAAALDTVNMDDVSAEKTVDALMEKLRQEKSEERKAEINRQILKVMARGERMDTRLNELHKAYTEIMNSNDPETAGAFDEVIASKILEVAEKVGATPLRDMNLEQLRTVYDMYKAVLKQVRDGNKAFAAGQKQEISQLAEKVAAELKQTPELKKLRNINHVKQFLWNNEKPIYAFERLGSETFTQLYKNLRNGEDTWYRDVNEANEYFRMAAKKYGYRNWDLDKSWEFTSTSGEKFRLNLSQIMSLYAYSKRDQAADHIREGGIQIDENTKTKVKTKLGYQKTVNVQDSTAYNISDDTLTEILSHLGQEQRDFADAMQKYLSVTMANKGNEVSVKLYDIKLFTEEFYWPLRVSRDYLPKSKAQDENLYNRIKNAGMTKSTIKGAKNTIVLSGFMETWTSHVNEMSMYHAMTLPMEDFCRVYNWKTMENELTAPESMRPIIQNRFGREATAYIDQLWEDLNKGVRTDPRENAAKNLTSKFKKASTMASLSVVVQQPTAVGRAFLYVEPKYFAGGKVGGKLKQSQTWEECKRYAPIAGIKEMGRFDTDMGRSTADYIMAKEYSGVKDKLKGLATDSGYRDEAFGWLAGKADEVTWCAIWDACKRKVAAEQKLTGEAMLQAAGELFTEVITKTQVYDSVFSRSGNMRSGNAFMGMLTSFAAEPTTSANMLEHAARELAKGNKGLAAKEVASVTVSTVFNSMAAAFIYALRDDDEDKTFLEKYLGHAVTGFLEDMNPITMIPGLRDVWSLAQGYDIERADMSILSDIIGTLNSIASLELGADPEEMDEEELEKYTKKRRDLWLQVMDGLFSFAGLPEKNIRRDINAVFNLFQKTNWMDSSANTIWYNLWQDVKDTTPVLRNFPKDSKTDTLYKAYLSGDPVFMERAEMAYDSDRKLDSALKKALRDNDPRVRLAAIAMNAGNKSERIRLTREIIAEGNFDQDLIISAISAEASSMEDKPESEYTRKHESIYTYEDFALEAAYNGAEMDTIRKDLQKVMVANGKKESGVEQSFNSKAVSVIRDMYEGETFTKEQAVSALVNAGLYDEDEATRKIGEWDFSASHDYSFGELKQAYQDGEITQSELRQQLITVGGKSAEEADAYIEDVNFENRYGFSYSDRKNAYISGKVSASELRSAMVSYGGLSGSEADRQIKAYDWMKQHPQYDLDVNTVLTYTKKIDTIGISVEDSGVQPDTFVKYQKLRSACKGVDSDGDGRADSGTVKSEALEVIDDLPLTDRQKDALYYLNGWSKKTINEAPWH